MLSKLIAWLKPAPQIEEPPVAVPAKPKVYKPSTKPGKGKGKGKK